MLGALPFRVEANAQSIATSGPSIGNPEGSWTLISTPRDAKTKYFRTCSTYLNLQDLQPGDEGCMLTPLSPPTLSKGSKQAWQCFLSQAFWFKVLNFMQLDCDAHGPPQPSHLPDISGRMRDISEAMILAARVFSSIGPGDGKLFSIPCSTAHFMDLSCWSLKFSSSPVSEWEKARTRLKLNDWISPRRSKFGFKTSICDITHKDVAPFDEPRPRAIEVSVIWCKYCYEAPNDIALSDVALSDIALSDVAPCKFHKTMV